MVIVPLVVGDGRHRHRHRLGDVKGGCSAKSGDFYLATNGDRELATNGNRELADSGYSLMAMGKT